MKPPTQTELFPLLTLSSEASRDRVRTSPPPGKAQDSTASDQGFGVNTPGLWGSLDPVGSLLRMSVLSVLEGWTGFVLTWRAKGTPSGRFWWVLGRSAHLTGGKEFGSWPTARPYDANSFPSADSKPGTGGSNLARIVVIGSARRSWTTPTQDDAGGRATQYKQGGTSLSAQLRSAWPTPTAKDEAASGAACYSTESGRHPGTTLTDAANGLWASPMAHGARLGYQGRKDPTKKGTQKSLTTQAVDRNFPTPKASDGRSKGTGGTPDHGLDAMARAGLLDQGSHSGSGKSRGWPTPRSQDEADGPSMMPEAHYARQTRKKAANPLLNELHKPLVVTVREETEGRGVLNSRWVAQLMGYPSDWCELPSDVLDALTAKPSKPSETASCPKSSRSSAEPSSSAKE